MTTIPDYHGSHQLNQGNILSSPDAGWPDNDWQHSAHTDEPAAERREGGGDPTPESTAALCG